MTLTLLAPGDEERLERFLVQHADSSMFLRSNARRAGLAYAGAPYQATWVANVVDGEVVGVVAHGWNGILLVQAPGGVAALVREAIARSGRTVTGLGGPVDQVAEARSALAMADAPTKIDYDDDLFTLELAALRVPEALSAGRVSCRLPFPSDLPRLVAWRCEYAIEILGAQPGSALEREAHESLGRSVEEGNVFLLESGGQPVAMTGFNARLPDAVQVGGVYTPRPLRSRGHAGAAVAGSLLAARAEGATRAILFTSKDNVPARRCYLGLGFRIVGEHALVLFR